jgi:catechol 2,3-dioxygenase-like lactoylglutathione lyase family enzyme
MDAAAGAEYVRRAGQPDRHLALEDVRRLAVAPVHVQRRHVAGRHDELDEVTVALLRRSERPDRPPPLECFDVNDAVHVRYLVYDVEASIAFYTGHFGFELLSNQAPAFADVRRGNLRLLLSGPKSSAGRPMPDGRRPGPGGWNRIHLLVDDIAGEVERLRGEGVAFRSGVVRGPGGSQIVLDDPSGNPVELFQPR